MVQVVEDPVALLQVVADPLQRCDSLCISLLRIFISGGIIFGILNRSVALLDRPRTPRPWSGPISWTLRVLLLSVLGPSTAVTDPKGILIRLLIGVLERYGAVPTILAIRVHERIMHR